MAVRHHRGVIVVARSSNPEGRGLQEALTESGAGPSVEDMLLADIAHLNHGKRFWALKRPMMPNRIGPAEDTARSATARAPWTTSPIRG